MDKKTWSWCMAAFLLLSANAVGKNNKDVQKIPFKLYRNHLVIATGKLGHINNRNLLIDTGASPTVVDEALAHELGLKPVGQPAHGMTVVGGVAQTYYAILESLDLGPVHRASLVVAVANLSLMQAGAGVRIDAIVGLDALTPASFQIDYKTMKVSFGSIRTPASAVPMLQTAPFVIIETQVNGAAVDLAVDTGTSQLLLFGNDLPEAITSVPRRKTVKLSNLAGDLLAPEIQLADFKVGSEDLSGSIAVLTTAPNCCEFQGVFGISGLHFKRITFDFQHRLFGLELLDESDFAEHSAESCPAFSGASCGQALSPGFLIPRN